MDFMMFMVNRVIGGAEAAETAVGSCSSPDGSRVGPPGLLRHATGS